MSGVGVVGGAGEFLQSVFGRFLSQEHQRDCFHDEHHEEDRHLVANRHVVEDITIVSRSTAVIRISLREDKERWNQSADQHFPLHNPCPPNLSAPQSVSSEPSRSTIRVLRTFPLQNPCTPPSGIIPNHNPSIVS